MADARRERARSGRGGRGGGGGRNGGRNGGQSQAGGGGRGSNWFKGEGYNDHEAVSIDEQVVGISGFLAPTHRGFGGLVKQRFSDFLVRELPRGGGGGTPVALTSLARKKKHVSASFQELVAAFSGNSASEQDGDKKELLDALAERLGRRGHQLKLDGARAAETRDMRRMVALVTNELGKKKGKDFENFIERVAQLKHAEMERTSGAGGEVAGVKQDAEQEEPVFYIGGLNEKSERVFLHETMRRYGKGLVVADTITSEDQSQVIRVRRAFLVGEAKKGDRDVRKSWPIDQPEYLQFVLYRRNKDIVAVINQIASMLKVNPSIFSYADPKEKRGIVTQLCTAYRLPAEKLQSLQKFHANKPLDDYQYLIGGNLKYVSEKLGPGDCLGNSFSIVIRALAKKDLATPEEVQETVAHWRATGFINFFGLQRFGTSATPLHLVGRAVLRKDFKLAVLLLLRPQDGEASKIREAREHFRQHKDVAAALRMLPPYLISERAVLEGLLQHGADANELAFRNIPLTNRSAYVDAYLNYVWNEMASLRIAQLPRDRAVIGDLVFAKADEISRDADSNEPAVKKQKLATDGSSSSSSTATSGAPSSSSQSRAPGTDSKRVIVLTEANVDKYTIEDVVLPVPGYSVEFPTNEVGAAYQKMLTTDGVDLASWLGASAQHQYQQLGGSYRHVIKKPFNVSAHVTEYENMNTPLQLTDVDRLLNRSLGSWAVAASARVAAPEEASASETITPDAASDELKQQRVPKKVQRALVLNFSLDHGSDATIALRELMKQSSSMHIQWQLADKAHRASGMATGGPSLDNSKPAAGGGGPQSTASGSKRPRGGVLVSATGKADKKIIAQKKTQVSIGRPGFSLGKH